MAHVSLPDLTVEIAALHVPFLEVMGKGVIIIVRYGPFPKYMIRQSVQVFLNILRLCVP